MCFYYSINGTGCRSQARITTVPDTSYGPKYGLLEAPSGELVLVAGVTTTSKLAVYTKATIITDRAVYKPGDKVHVKVRDHTFGPVSLSLFFFSLSLSLCPCLSSSKHHAVCTEMVGLDLIKLGARQGRAYLLTCTHLVMPHFYLWYHTTHRPAQIACRCFLKRWRPDES